MNVNGGKKHKRDKNAKSKNITEQSNKYVPIAGEGQQYGIVVKMLGNRRLIVKTILLKEHLAIIPGKFKGRKNWISIGMLLLLNIRDFQDDRCDVIYIYNSRESKELQREGKLKGLIDINKTDVFNFGELDDEINTTFEEKNAFNFDDI